MTPSVEATPEAQEKIERLQAKHGQLAFFQSGTCADAGALKCLTRAELLPEDRDVKLGTVGGAPVFVDGEVYERHGGRPALVIDVAPGPAEGFSLEHLEDFHFFSRVPSPSGGESPENGRSTKDRR